MILADIFFWLLMVLGAYAVLVAYWVGAFALFPARVERCRAVYGARPLASTVTGIAVTVPLLILAGLLTQHVPHPVVQVPMTGVLLVVALLALIGSAGLALRIGAGLESRGDAESPWRRVLRGALVLGAVFVMPLLGWFLLFPWTLISGLGAFVLSRRAEERVLDAPPARGVDLAPEAR